MQEVELKFAVSAADVKRLRSLPLLRGAAARRERLVSTYYDTPDFAVLHAGFGLRVRRVGRRRIVTLKSAGAASAGLHTRREIERPFVARRPLYGQIADTRFRARIGESVGALLEPLFVTDIRRTSWEIKLGRARLEVALDEGSLCAGERRLPLREIEIELKRGRPAALFEFARTLLDALPLSPENRSKAERGYRLAGHPATPPRKARTPRFKPAADVAEAARQILAECVRHIDENSSGVVHERDPEYLHQLRVGVRRTRAALAVFATALPPVLLEELKAELRWLMQEIGPGRDWDVFVHDTLRSEMFAGFEAHAALEQKARRQASVARQRARKAVAAPRYGAIVLELSGWLATAGQPAQDSDETRVAELADRVLTKRHRRLHKCGKNLASLNDPERHEVRIAAKKLRYAAEFFAPLFDEARAQTYLAALEVLQDALGSLNDIAVTAGLVESLLGPDAQPVLEALKRKKRRELRGLGEVWDLYARAMPFWAARI